MLDAMGSPTENMWTEVPTELAEKRGRVLLQGLLDDKQRMIDYLLAEIDDLDLAACGWTVEVIKDQLRKRNLLRHSRSVAAFQALVDEKVWPADAVPTEQTAMLPSFRSLEVSKLRPALVALFKKVLRGQRRKVRIKKVV